MPLRSGGENRARVPDCPEYDCGFWNRNNRTRSFRSIHRTFPKEPVSRVESLCIRSRDELFERLLRKLLKYLVLNTLHLLNIIEFGVNYVYHLFGVPSVVCSALSFERVIRQ